MKIAFRVDASTSMGIGHFMRCLTLSEELRQGGAQIHFICREHIGNLIGLLEKKIMAVTVLPASVINGSLHSENYSDWLGVTQVVDAEQTIDALKGEHIDWLIVDHYGIDAEWEQQLRPYTEKLMVVDDLANRPHNCDLLLDQNYSVNGESRYVGLVPEFCKLLLGPSYALIRPEYLYSRKNLYAPKEPVTKIFVFFPNIYALKFLQFFLDNFNLSPFFA